MTVKFYLKRPKPGPNSTPEAKARFNPNSKTAVYALVNYESNTVKIFTGESIPAKYWNPDTHSARNTSGFPEHPEFNQRLTNIKSTISKIFLDYKNNNDHHSPEPAILKPLIETALKRGVEKYTFLTYFEDFVNRSLSGQRKDSRGGKSIRQGVAKGYKTTYNHLKDFSKVWRRKLDFATIDLEFHSDFVSYLAASPRSLSANTIASNIQRIKAVLAEATEKGINSNLFFKSKRFVKGTEEADTIYLSLSELEEMEGLELKDNPRLENVRDLFLIGAYTGLRFSDFSILKAENIKEGFIRINQVKTGAPVVIPVHTVVKKVFKRYNGGMPRSISNVKMNAYLKEIGELMTSLNKLESKRITKGGVTVTKTVEKWRLLTSHAARRSFASNEFKAGTPSLTIMAITGHRSEASFRKYIRVTNDEHAHMIKKLWADRQNDKKVGRLVKLK